MPNASRDALSRARGLLQGHDLAARMGKRFTLATLRLRVAALVFATDCDDLLSC
jgi:hypothetical protein